MTRPSDPLIIVEEDAGFASIGVLMTAEEDAGIDHVGCSIIVDEDARAEVGGSTCALGFPGI